MIDGEIRIPSGDENNESNESNESNGMGLAKMSESINNIVKVIRQISFDSLISAFSQIGKKLIELFQLNLSPSSYMSSFSNALKRFGEALLEAYENPYSYFNFTGYQEQLDAFHWAWPFDIAPEELKSLIEKAEDERQFDKLIASFFTEERMENLCDYVLSSLPRKHRIVWRQITDAYEREQYALINNATISIIDNILGTVLVNKGLSSRKGILRPIVDFYANNYSLSEIGFIFELTMLSNNIDMLFADYRFNEKIKIETNKKVRRHLAAHGYMFSNQKIDSIMLMNTLAALLRSHELIKPFEKTLKYEKKRGGFYVGIKPGFIKRRIEKKEILIGDLKDDI